MKFFINLVCSRVSNFQSTTMNELKKYLEDRKSERKEIALVLDIVKEKKEENSLTALKLVCVLDYYTEKYGFYEGMKSHPKLLKQILTFYSYEGFKYFHYQLSKNLVKIIGNRLLCCKVCDLLAPYETILSHTASGHNIHMGSKECAYCIYRNLLSDSTHSIDTCYRNYLIKNDIDENSVVDTSKFFAMLKEIATKLDVLITRHDGFGGKGGKGKKEYVKVKIHGFPKTCTVRRQTHTTKKQINDNNLNLLYKDVLDNMKGGNVSSRMFSNETTDEPLNPVNS